jgi:heat shock protein HtpX
MLLWSTTRGSGGSGGGYGGGGWGSSGGGSSRSRSRGGGGAIIILILIAIAIFLIARLLAIALNFAMSRKREYLADAGSVELTKNADAMISALRKIEGHSEMPAPAQVQEMFLDLPRARGLGGLFATHPPIDARVANLVRFAGGHDPGPYAPPPAASGETPEASPQANAAPPLQPWGETPTGPWGPPAG